MTRTHFALPLLAALCLGASGCMTMFNGTTQKVGVVTYPIRTNVKVTDSAGKLVYEGPAPAELTLKRSEEYDIAASAPGYRPAKVHAESSTPGINVASGCLTNMFAGFLGIFVDLGTGAMKEFDGEGIELTLLRDKGPAQAQPASAPVGEADSKHVHVSSKDLDDTTRRVVISDALD